MNASYDDMKKETEDKEKEVSEMSDKEKEMKKEADDKKKEDMKEGEMPAGLKKYLDKKNDKKEEKEDEKKDVKEMQDKKSEMIKAEIDKMKKEMDRHEARIKQLEIDCRSVKAWSNILTPTYGSLTKYPKIFDCYWADFKVDLDVENHKQIEAENRNKFVEEFNISHSMRGKKKPNYINEKMDRNGKLNLDHGEVYKTIDGDYVLMVSPYGECDDEEYAKAGWGKYYRCYNHCTANTYIQVVEKKQRKPKKVV